MSCLLSQTIYSYHMFFLQMNFYKTKKTLHKMKNDLSSNTFGKKIPIPIGSTNLKLV